MIAAIARPLAVVAALGWVVSVVASLAGLAGAALPEWLLGAMFVGLAPLWIATILLMIKQGAGVQQKDMWKAAFRGCPRWLRYAIWASLGYTFLMFFLTMGWRPEAAGIGFMGVFYATALGTFVTSAVTGDEPTKCANGHDIGPFDKFCRECGASINRVGAIDDIGRSRSRRDIP
jgi:hypothetical protein